jgi:DNA repair exonuclease SbcCD ATPase subunit
MLRLKRVEIAGFKSFYEKVDLAFPGSVTAVVGPNGCGKSNISDAVALALVESTWDEALKTVSERLTDIKSRYGPRAMAFLSSAKVTNEENYLFMKMARAAFGTNNVDHCARL